MKNNEKKSTKYTHSWTGRPYKPAYRHNSWPNNLEQELKWWDQQLKQPPTKKEWIN